MKKLEPGSGEGIVELLWVLNPSSADLLVNGVESEGKIRCQHSWLVLDVGVKGIWDESLSILRKESDGASTGGWSKVAAKNAAPKATITVASIAAKNAFSALGGNKVTFQRRPEKTRTRNEPIVDDWEAAELAEEEKEQTISEDEDRHPPPGDAEHSEPAIVVDDASTL